jgi:DNA helicase II / ATP-dependent DNA helicase PcrA
MNLQNYQLNENQRSAVEWTEGPLLVLAGPGSGKTLVLTLRAVRILKADPDASLLALTFTTKAADEMRERLNGLLGGRADRAHLCTFHSFAGDILRQHGSHVGIKPDFALLTQDEDRFVLLRQMVQGMEKDELDVSSIPPDERNLLVLIDRLFAESYDGEPAAPGMSSTPSWVPEFFRRYCSALVEANRLDYGALLYFARRLLSRHPSVARLTRMAWRFICVDEFQDTNKAQYDLLRGLISDVSPNLFVVADDDQIIYQWNGASPERLQSLRRDFSMGIVQLPENFRCPPEIIQMANNLISKNRTRTEGKKPLIAHKAAGEFQTLSVSAFQDEASEHAGVITSMKEGHFQPEECTVLARSTKMLQKVALALEESGQKAYVPQRKNEFECASTCWLHAALRLANARHDREFLRRLCVAWKAFAGVLIEVNDVETVAALNGGDFLRAWTCEALARSNMEPQTRLLERMKNDLVERLAFIELLEWFWEQSWMDEPLEVEETSTWRELHAALLSEHGRENITLHLYLQEMDLKSKTPARQLGAVSCLTVHSAKGMEFKHVFLIGMADEVFPSFQAVKKGDTSSEMEEERRNCFVAITRVKETLHISWANRYNGYPKRPSRFLSEMGLESSNGTHLALRQDGQVG